MNYVKGRGWSAIAAGISLVFVVFLVAALSVVVSAPLPQPQAQAQNLTWRMKLDAEKYITDIGIVDKDGNPVEGNIDHNLEGDSKGTAFHVKGEFPDDAKKGDYLEFESTIAVSYPSNKFDLTNSDGTVFATLYITGYDKRTNSQRYRVALAKDAENYVNKEFEFTSVIQGFNIPCTGEDVKPDGTLDFFINGNRTGKGLWGQETQWYVDGQTCNTATNPYPRGFNGVDPISKMKCHAFEPATPKLEDVRLSDGRVLKNNLRLGQGVDLYVQAGGYKTFNDITITYDANGNNKTEDARQFFAHNEMAVRREISSGDGFAVSRIPVRHEEFEAVEGGVTPGAPGITMKNVITDVAFIPHNFLFPDKKTAQEYKNYVVYSYDEDVWDNTNNAFAKLSNEQAKELAAIAVEVWNTWVSSHLKLVEYDENRGYAKFVLRDASGLGELVTADDDTPLRAPAQLEDNYHQFGLVLDADTFGTYAPYKGSMEYSGPKVTYKAVLDVEADPNAKGVYAGSCTTDATGSMGRISGAAWGDEIIRPVDGTVRWEKWLVRENGGAVMEETDTSRMEWEIRRVDEPGHDPLVVKDRVPATRGDDSLPDINELPNVFEVTGLALGEYELRETKTPFGVREPAAPVQFSITGDTVVSLNPVRNVWYPSRIVWEKVDFDTGETLKGSAWSLQWKDKDGNESSTGVFDCVAGYICPKGSIDRDPAPGKFDVKALPGAEYTLQELDSPDKYALSKEVFEVGKVSEAETVDLGEIPNKRLASPTVCVKKVDADTGETIDLDMEFNAAGGSGRFASFSRSGGEDNCPVLQLSSSDPYNMWEKTPPEGYVKLEDTFSFNWEYDADNTPKLVFYDPATAEPLDKYPFEVVADTSDKYNPKYTFTIPNRKIPPVQVPFELPNAGEHPFLVLTLGLGIIGALSAAVALRRRDA